MALGLFAQLACLWEASAAKVGNVHRRRDFPSLTFNDFILSAAAIGPVFEHAQKQRVGTTILHAIQATRGVVATNTNLGMVLLLAPLAAAKERDIEAVLNDLTVVDSQEVFTAIRLANPGGMGEVKAQDLATEPTLPLREIMALAQDRDLVARQYANGFHEVLQEGVPHLRAHLHSGLGLEEAIILTHVQFLADHPDSLIARKLGFDVSVEVSRRAREVLAATRDDFVLALHGLDLWLCAEGHSRNPGTSADLVAASLFAALCSGIIKLPLPYPWSSGFHHG